MGTDSQPQPSPAPQRPSTPAFRIPFPIPIPCPPTPRVVHAGGFGVGMATCFSGDTRWAPTLSPSIPTLPLPHTHDSPPRHQPTISIPCCGSATTVLLHLCPSCACPTSIPCHQPANSILYHHSSISMFCHGGPTSILLHPLPRVSLPMDVLPPSHVTKRASPSPAMKVPPPSHVTSMVPLPWRCHLCQGGGTSLPLPWRWHLHLPTTAVVPPGLTMPV